MIVFNILPYSFFQWQQRQQAQQRLDRVWWDRHRTTFTSTAVVALLPLSKRKKTNFCLSTISTANVAGRTRTITRRSSPGGSQRKRKNAVQQLRAWRCQSRKPKDLARKLPTTRTTVHLFLRSPQTAESLTVNTRFQPPSSQRVSIVLTFRGRPYMTYSLRENGFKKTASLNMILWSNIAWLHLWTTPRCPYHTISFSLPIFSVTSFTVYVFFSWVIS